MSFFVSKSIEDIIDENCILSSSSEESQNDGSFFGVYCYDDGEKINLPMTEVKNSENGIYVADFKTNLNVIEKLFFKKLKIKQIIIGRYVMNVEEYFISSVKENSKFYTVTIKLHTKEELNV